MPHKTQNIGVANQIGAYSDAVETGSNMRWLFTSGTPGLETNGDLPPDITGQAELAWKHLLHMLEQADMAITDLVKVTQYLTRRRHPRLRKGAQADSRRCETSVHASRHTPARTP